MSDICFECVRLGIAEPAIYQPRHLADAKHDSAYKESHKPRHCAGATSCLHDHAGASPTLPPMGTFRQRIARITGRDKRLAPVEIVGRAS